MNYNLSELLKGCSLLRVDGNVVVQTAGAMSIALLTIDPEFSYDERFSSPFDARFNNRSYGELQVENRTSHDIIITMPFAVMTSYAAQDHALPKGIVVKAGKKTLFLDAGCVQGSQGGYIAAGRGNDLRLMPLVIREALFAQIGHTNGYSGLYPAVNELGNKTGTQTGAYLEKYFNQNRERLDGFIAQFEHPHNVIGVVVFDGMEILAIDRFPSFSYAEAVWETLVRDCYGSVVLANDSGLPLSARAYDLAVEKTAMLPGETVVENLQRVVAAAKVEAGRLVENRLDEWLSFGLAGKIDSNHGEASSEYESIVLTGDAVVGQAIVAGGAVLSMSLVRKGKVNMDTLRDALRYKSHAARQENFTTRAR